MLGQIGVLLSVILPHFLERLGDELETSNKLIFVDLLFKKGLIGKMEGKLTPTQAGVFTTLTRNSYETPSANS